MLERVPLLEKELDQYVGVVGSEAVAEIREAAEPLRGARVLHLSATAYGGGVAELLATARPAAAQRGDRSRVAGPPRQRRVLHDHQAGAQRGRRAPTSSGPRRCSAGTSSGSSTTPCCSRTPGTSSSSTTRSRPRLLHFLRDHPSFGAGDRTRWVWRCHIDLTDANPTVWEFFRPFVELHDASVWTLESFVPATLKMDRVEVLPPCIDPLSVKNLDLARPFCEELTRQYGVDTEAPDRVPDQPLRPVEGPGRGDRGVPARARARPRGPAAARGFDGDRRPGGVPRLGGDRARLATATRTSTSCRTCTRSGRCRSTRSSGSRR